MGKILAILRMVGVLLVLAVCLGRLMVLSALCGKSDARGFRFRRKFTRGSQRVLGVRALHKGQPHSGPALYVSNHRSLVDPLIQLDRLDVYVVSKAEVAEYPLIGRGASETGVIFVKRQKMDSRAAAKQAIRDALKGGKSILIYPEGTTSNFDTTREFKIGSFQIAAEEGIPVVPVAIDYANPLDYWFEMPMFAFFLRKFAKWRTIAAMSIGTPFTHEDPRVLMQQTRAWINSEIKTLRKELNQG